MKTEEKKTAQRRRALSKKLDAAPVFIGPALLECDANGKALSRVGTVFLRTSGLVTEGKMHATQRIKWLEHLEAKRKRDGLPPPTDEEADMEANESVDLLMDDHHVFIRPDPKRPDLAAAADEFLQEHTRVSRTRIRYLNISNPEVRKSLRERGELWRIMPQPISVDDMIHHITDARIAMDGEKIYHYNKQLGVRYVTAAEFRGLARLGDKELRAHLLEIQKLLNRRNRFNNAEAAFFPAKCGFGTELKNADIASVKDVRAWHAALAGTFAAAVPEALRADNPKDETWRNEMCRALSIESNPTTTDEELFNEFSPEFFRQIRWLPGAHFNGHEIHFDPIFNETHLPDPALQDPRARAIIHGYAREYRNIQYINVGRVQRSLSITRPLAESNHSVYIVEIKIGQPESGAPPPGVLHALRVVRFIKWGPAERLDKDPNLTLERAAFESDEYTDFILDRRLGCLQFGMNLHADIAVRRIRETYSGANPNARGQTYFATYLARAYVPGYASDKIPPHFYKTHSFAAKLARLLGNAAAINLVIGRASPVGDKNQNPYFDDGDEIIQIDPATNLPQSLTISDPTGAFAHYDPDLYSLAHHYAKSVNERVKFLPDPVLFARVYLKNISTRLHEIRGRLRADKPAFYNLFNQLPDDPNGNIRHRWEAVLARLLPLDIPRLILHIAAAIDLPTEKILPK